MIDLKELKQRRDEIVRNVSNRYMNCDVDEVIRLQEERSALMQQAELMRSRRNEVAGLMKSKIDSDSRARLIAEGKQLKDDIATTEEKLAALNADYDQKARQIPNYAHPEAPIGKEDKDSTVVKFVGKPPVFDFAPLDHVQLGQNLDLLDFDTATKVSGPKFYYIKNKAVILQMALERYALDIVMKHGFMPMITPDVAKEEVLLGIGFNPRGAESNIYTVEGTDTCLVGTAEITLGGYMEGRILEKKDLPIRY